MNIETAPVIFTVNVPQQEDTVPNIDYQKINEFNKKIDICNSCIHLVEDIRPTCAILNKPLSILSEVKTCPKGNW